MRITSIEELKKWSFDTYVNDIPYHFDYEYFRSHFLWATFVCIDKNTRKIKDDSIFPIYVNILTETDKYDKGRQFFLFSRPQRSTELATVQRHTVPVENTEDRSPA